MKKLLLISILASILVVAFNKCYCEHKDSNDTSNSFLLENTDTSLATVPVRLRKRT